MFMIVIVISNQKIKLIRTVSLKSRTIFFFLKKNATNLELHRQEIESKRFYQTRVYKIIYQYAHSLYTYVEYIVSDSSKRKMSMFSLVFCTKNTRVTYLLHTMSKTLMKIQ